MAVGWLLHDPPVSHLCNTVITDMQMATFPLIIVICLFFTVGSGDSKPFACEANVLLYLAIPCTAHSL